MANTFKRSIAMLLVLNMLTGMIPVQALADEGAPDVEVAVVFHSESSSKEASSSSDSGSSDSGSSDSGSSDSGSSDSGSSGSSDFVATSSSEPTTESFDSGKPDVSYDSELTYGDNIGGTVTEKTEEGTNSNGDDVVKETTTVETSGKTDDGEKVTGSETFVETTTTTEESIRVETEQSGWETTEGDYDVDSKTDVPDVEAPIIQGEEKAEEVKPGTESETDENGVTTETTTTVEKVENEDGTTTDVVTETEEVTDADGNVTSKTETTTETTTDADGVTTETTVKTEEVTDENGETVTNTSTSTSTTTTQETTNEDGTTTETVTKKEEATEADGTVTKTDTTVSTTTDENGVIQNVQTNVKVEETTTEVTGDQPTDENDKTFDFTETDVTIVRDVTVDAEFGDAVDSSNTDGLTAVAPDGKVDGKYYDKKEGLLNGLSPTQINGSLTNEQYVAALYDLYLQNYGKEAADAFYQQTLKPTEEGYDYQWTGHADATNAVRAVYVDVVYAKDPVTGETLKDDDGNYIIESYKYTGKYNDGMGSTPAIFVLTKEGENGDEYFYGYCIDAETEAVPSSWYKISNLEDSDYYPDEESANKLRAIVQNGYWGKADGEGSADAMIEKVIAYYNTEDAPTTVTVQDKNGKDLTYNVRELLAALEENGKLDNIDADALTVTQAAVWSYANGTPTINDGKDGTIIEAIYSAVKPKDNLANCDRDWDYDRDALLAAMYQWMMNLEGVPQDDESVSTVINEKNSFEDIGMTIKEQVADHANNQDDKDDNDVYNTELNFTLAFVPDQENDSLLVYVLDPETQEPMRDANGDQIIKRLAGENGEGEDFDTITADENGTYTISGLQLAENSDFTFDLQLSGTHNLKDGVYIYSAYGGASASQTMVGMAGGTQNVNVKSSMSISFDVDESKHVVATRKWSTSGDPEETPRDPGDNPPPPALYRITRGVGQLEIIDEEVPLAEPPQTGDISMLWFAMIVMSACGLCMLNLFERKREQA